MVISILVPISPAPSSPPNETMTSTTENSLQSFLPSPSGASTYKERPTLLPSSPTIRICPTSKIPVNFLADKLAGLFSYRTLISFGKFFQAPNLLLLMPSLITTKLTPPLTMPILPSFQNQQLSMLSISPLPAISNHLPQ